MMKNSLRSRMLRYGIGLFACTNTILVNAQLELTLKPEKSMGFAAWNEPVDSSTLFIYEKTGSTYNLISSKTTTQKYIQIDPVYFNTPNYYYRIVGTKTGNPPVETGYVPALPVGGNGYNELGTKVCNGRSYAYELVAFNNSPNANVRLTTRHAQTYYNDSTLVWIPYYQAIPWSVFNNLPSDHPYKYPLNLYDKRTIDSNLGNGPFLDRYGFGVPSGILVEKQMDQFIPYLSAGTDASAGFPFNSSPPITGVGSTWVNFFNDHIDPTTYNTGVNYFSPTIIPDLDCIAAHLPLVTPAPGPSWYDWLKKYHELVLELENEIELGGGTLTSAVLEEMIGTIDIDDTEDIYTTGVTFKKFNAESYVNFVTVGNSLEVHSASSTIPAGLYQANVFSNEGSILPLYIDLKYAIPISPLKDYAEVIIAPNPVVMNDLTINIKNKKPGPITIELYDMMGNLLYTDGFNMTQKEVDKHYDLSFYFLPRKQILAKVIFLDGSSKTVGALRF